MPIFKMYAVRPLRSGWAVYCLGEAVTKAMTRHQANMVWQMFIAETRANRHAA